MMHWPKCEGSSYLVVATVAVTLCAIAIAASGSEADTVDVFGDWVIPLGSTTALENTAIDVRGDVSVEGHLILRNCTLDINLTDDGVGELNVSGQLEAFGTVIRGTQGRIMCFLSGPTLLDRCSMSHFVGQMHNYPCVFVRSASVIANTTISDFTEGGLWLSSAAQLRNVTMREGDGNYIQLSPPYYGGSKPFAQLIEGCRLEAPVPAGDSVGIKLSELDTDAVGVNLAIRETALVGFAWAMRLGNGPNHTTLVEGCTFTSNSNNVWITHAESTLRFRNVTIGPDERTVGYGVYMTTSRLDNIIFDGLVVDDVADGLALIARFVEDFNASIGNLTIRNCTRGLNIMTQTGAQGWLRLTIHNSTITDTQLAVLAGGRLGVILVHTEHTPGSGRVSGVEAWIRGLVTIDIAEVRWHGGPAIRDGMLVLRDESTALMATLDVAHMDLVSVAGWELSSTINRTRYRLVPSMMVAFRTFTGLNIDIWGPMPVTVEMIDDVDPQVTMSSPVEGAFYGSSTIMVEGTWTEKGSGVAGLRYRLDEASPMEFRDPGEGTWWFALSDLTDGPHTLAVWAYDGVGNEGLAVEVGFTIDTMEPTIELEPVPGSVNSTPLRLVGSTEVGAVLAVNELVTVTAPDGSFEALVDLVEGPNTIDLRTVDQAGNTDAVTVTVVLDTRPPTLRVTSPKGPTWVSVAVVLVEGTTEPGAAVLVNGAAAEVVGGAFSHELEFGEGEHLIVVTATDAAGNQAMSRSDCYVDWTPPTIEVISPAGSPTYSPTTEAQIYGRVLDASPVGVTLNGLETAVIDGEFVTTVTIVEGHNSFTIMATDMAGNTASTSIVVVRDTTLPGCTVELAPQGGLLAEAGGDTYSTTATLELHIVLDEEGFIKYLWMDEGPSREFIVPWNIAETPQVTVSFHDLAGNEGAPYRRLVHHTPDLPSLVVNSPEDGKVTDRLSVEITGKTDPGMNLTVNGNAYAVGPDGSFTVQYPLLVGPNALNVTVTDIFGRTTTVTHKVTREKVEHFLGPSSLWPWMVAVLLVLICLLAIGLKLRRDGGRRR